MIPSLVRECIVVPEVNCRGCSEALLRIGEILRVHVVFQQCVSVHKPRCHLCRAPEELYRVLVLFVHAQQFPLTHKACGERYLESDRSSDRADSSVTLCRNHSAVEYTSMFVTWSGSNVRAFSNSRHETW